jgi:hypothetical protein
MSPFPTRRPGRNSFKLSMIYGGMGTVTVVFSGSEPGVGLVVNKPAGAPAVPSVIFSGWRID